MTKLQGGRKSDSTDTCSSYICSDVCPDRSGSMGETRYYTGLRPADAGAGIRTGNAQYGCSVGDLEFGQLFYKSFLVYGGTVRGDFQWH